MSTHCFVSIPKRVSEALNLWDYSLAMGDLHVSIPKRVSEALNLRDGLIDSLSQCFVSIPKRVSEALNQ